MLKTSMFSDFYCLPNKLALMGLRPGIFSAVPDGTVPGAHVYPGLTSWATFSRPLRQAQGRLCGTVSQQEWMDPVECFLLSKADLQESANAIVGAVPLRFRPMYAGANMGHPSSTIGLCYETDSFGTVPEQQFLTTEVQIFVALNGPTKVVLSYNVPNPTWHGTLKWR